MGFDGKMVVPWGMTRLPVEDMEVQINFVVVEAFSPYTAIMASRRGDGALNITPEGQVPYSGESGIVGR